MFLLIAVFTSYDSASLIQDQTSPGGFTLAFVALLVGIGFLVIGFLNHLFMTGAISQDRQRCQFPFVLDEKPTVVPERSAESGQEARERFFMEQLARTQSAWRVG